MIKAYYPEQLFIVTLCLVGKTFLNHEGFWSCRAVLSGAEPETFVIDFLRKLGVAAPMQGVVWVVEAGIIPFYPRGNK